MAKKTVDLNEVRDVLYDRLKPSGWANKLHLFIQSSDFMKILTELQKQSDSGQRFTPKIIRVFRALEQCPYDNLKVVMMGQDPYYQILNGKNVADGIPFSCGNTGVIQPSLKYVYKALEKTVYPFGTHWEPDLKCWSNQGVLMLNAALTTEIGKVGAHYGLWKPFLNFLFDILTFQNPGLVYLFMGRIAQEWSKRIPTNNYVIQVSHPASAAHKKEEEWECEDCFNRVNQYLQKMNNTKIVW